METNSNVLALEDVPAGMELLSELWSYLACLLPF